MNKTILIVDDAKLMRNIIKGSLYFTGDYEIFEAANGQEAIEMYSQIRPDVVTMDITMEKMNGVEAATAILKQDPLARIIIITSLGQEKLLDQCIQAGVCDYIVKPFSKARVASAVQKALHHMGVPMIVVDKE